MICKYHQRDIVVLTDKDLGFVGIVTNQTQSQLHINDGQYATFQMTNAITGTNANNDNEEIGQNTQKHVV